MNINLVSSLLTLNKYLSVGLFLGKGMFKDHTKDANERVLRLYYWVLITDPVQSQQ